MTWREAFQNLKPAESILWTAANRKLTRDATRLVAPWARAPGTDEAAAGIAEKPFDAEAEFFGTTEQLADGFVVAAVFTG